MSLLFSPRTARVNGGDKQRVDTLPDNLQLPEALRHTSLNTSRSRRTPPKKVRKVSTKPKSKKNETLMNPLEFDENSPNVDM